MKKLEIEQVIGKLKELKNLTDSQEYLVSSKANELFIQIMPILDKELQRLSETNVEVNSPALLLFEYKDIEKTDKSVTEFINRKLQELVMNEYKIIDYGLFNKNTEGDILIYIKYTN